MLWLLVAAAAVYAGLMFGGVYLRRMSLAEKMEGQLAYAGQLAEETIRAQLIEKIEEMNLPPEASRVRMRHPTQRTIEFTVAYTESVNLGFTTVKIPVSLTKSRRF
jgi:hypothetical protein